MKLRKLPVFLIQLLALCLALANDSKGQPTAPSDDEQAIRRSAAAYREAFNAGDPESLARLWIENGENIDQTGFMLRGREAITTAFKKFFAQHQGAAIEISIESITFPSPEVAVETGTTKTTVPGVEVPVGGHYTAIHVKKDGEWLLHRVNEGPPLPPSNYKYLKDLEWLVGHWSESPEAPEQAGTAETPVVYVSCRWSVNRNFLIRNFTSTVKGRVTATGTQYIGWYAPAKQIRSWTFDSKGHIIASVWTGGGDEWTVKTSEALPSGEVVSDTETLSRKDADTQVWNCMNRTTNGETAEPAVVVVKRHR